MTNFQTANTYYLRISSIVVLLLSLHLDYRHLNWMNNIILERVLIALRDRIPIKLNQELDYNKSSNNKKATVDVFRGGN